MEEQRLRTAMENIMEAVTIEVSYHEKHKIYVRSSERQGFTFASLFRLCSPGSVQEICERDCMEIVWIKKLAIVV